MSVGYYRIVVAQFYPLLVALIGPLSTGTALTCLSICLSVCVVDRRHEDTRDAAAGHASDAGQRIAALLLRLLHLRHRRGPTLGRHTQAALLPQGFAQHQVSRVSQGEP